VTFNVLLTTKILSLNMISEDMEYRHQLILKLHGTGYSDKEISKYLNEKIFYLPEVMSTILV
jgi:hypothetical protein